MKINKLSVAEFSKAIKRQGIFGMIAVLIIALTICALIYNPEPKDDFRVNIMKENTALMLSEFNENPLIKSYYETSLQDEVTRLNFYFTNSVNQIGILSARLEEIKYKILELGQIVDADVFDKPAAKQTVTLLREKLVNFNVIMEQYFNPNQIASYANSAKKDEAIEIVDSVINMIPATITDLTAKTWYEATRNSIRSKDLHTVLTFFINSLEPITVKPENINQILTNINTFETTWKTEILAEIDAFMTANPADNNFTVKETLNGLFTKYVTAMRSAISYSKTALLIELAGAKTDTELQNYVTFQTYNSFVVKTDYQKANYCLANKFYSINAQDTVSFNSASSFASNAFDFAFFATEIATVVILIFSVFFASGMIAGEQASGTMKMLAIRPFSRKKIIISKIRATMGITVLFLFLAFIASLCIGFGFYGFSLTPFLVVFNASSTFLLSPILLSLIYITCAAIKVLVFVSLAFLLSVVFRSNTGAVIISFVAYILTLVLNSTLSIYPVYSYFPFASFDLFKFFGGGIVASEANGTLISIFSTPILNGSNFYISFGVTIVIIWVMIALALRVFKKKDIA